MSPADSRFRLTEPQNLNGKDKSKEKKGHQNPKSAGKESFGVVRADLEIGPVGGWRHDGPAAPLGDLFESPGHHRV